MKKNNIQAFIASYFDEIKKSIELLDIKAIEKIIKIITESYQDNKTIYILGNGGASSTSSHLACDLGKGTLRRVYDKKEKRLRVISLTDNVALITAYANDISFDNIFLQQLRNLVEKGDLVIGISGSGNTENVVRAMKYAKKVGAKTIGLAGFTTGGKLASVVDLPVVIQSNHYGPIEDIHHMLGHIIAGAIADIKRLEKSAGKSKKENKAVPFRVTK